MAVEFHESDDSHADYPHRVVTVRDGTQFIICAECDHLIIRDVPGCECSQDCHALAIILASITPGR